MTSATKIQFLGATGTVTGSKYLVSAGNSQILLDCGLFQGYKQLRLRNWDAFPFDVRSLDAVVLTHAHLDHSGYLPLLIKHGYRGKIYCSEATYELCKLLLPDSDPFKKKTREKLIVTVFPNTVPRYHFTRKKTHGML